jgi:very-short-patch-repair endonuclease
MDPPASRLEAKVAERLKQSDLPRPESQWEVRDGGRLLARVDFAYPEAKLAIEADGYRFHSGRAAWQRDRVRSNALTSRGWLVLRVTWDDLSRRSDEVAAEIRGGLRSSKPEP